MDSTNTCSFLPPAYFMAISKSCFSSARYSSELRPRYWLFTPIKRVTILNVSLTFFSLIAASNSSVVHPVLAMISGSAISMLSELSLWLSCTGKRSFSFTISPMVYESPMARYVYLCFTVASDIIKYAGIRIIKLIAEIKVIISARCFPQAQYISVQ